MADRSPSPVFVNGRYLSQPLSGVQRFAIEVTAALGRVWPSDLGPSPLLLVPPNVDPRDSPMGVEIVGRRSGSLWEQLDLPGRASSGVLVNLGNTAPMGGRRQIIIIHDTAPISFPRAYSWRFRSWYRVMQRVVVYRGARVVTVSQFARHEIADHLGVPPASIAVMSEGADHMGRLDPDTDAIKRFGLEPNRFVLAVGNLAEHKNIAALGATARELPSLGMELVITGANDLAIFRTNRISPPEPARYIGRVSDEALRALYDAASCFVFPSLYEGFGLPAVEAMACGCPVVASDIPALREVCGLAAHYVDPRSAASVARGVRDVVTDKQTASRLRRDGAARVADLTWDRAAHDLLRVIRTIAT